MSELDQDHKGFYKKGNTFVTLGEEIELFEELPKGIYSLMQDHRTGQMFFKKTQITSDKIIDLPSPEYSKVVNEMKKFLSPETKSLFNKYGYLYKRSTLLFGKPGTGKTCIINRVAEEVIKNDGIVLFDPAPEILLNAFNVFRDLQKDRPILVIYEELDTWLEDDEKPLLSILDGETQMPNMMYLVTTNFIENIPDRIKRPGRFSSVIEVDFPNLEARLTYLKHKLGEENDSLVNQIAELTKGFSIDELKETVLATICLGQDTNEVVDKIKKVKGLVYEVVNEDGNKSKGWNWDVSRAFEEAEEELDDAKI